MYTERRLQQSKRWPAWSTLQKHTATIHLPTILGGVRLHYLCYSEEGCSWKSSSCSNVDIPSPRPNDSLHLAEKLWKEFAQIHVWSCTKFQDAGQRIFVSLSTTGILFAANVGYHKSCYQAFRAPSWKKTFSRELFCSERNYITEFIYLRRGVCTLRQLTERWFNTKHRYTKFNWKEVWRFPVFQQASCLQLY